MDFVIPKISFAENGKIFTAEEIQKGIQEVMKSEEGRMFINEVAETLKEMGLKLESVAMGVDTHTGRFSIRATGYDLSIVKS